MLTVCAHDEELACVGSLQCNFSVEYYFTLHFIRFPAAVIYDRILFVRVCSLKGSKRRRRSRQEPSSASRVSTGSEQNVDPAVRKQTAMQVVIDIMQDKDELSLGDLLSKANTTAPAGDTFTRAELKAALTSLDNDNKIMFYDDMVHKV